MDATVLVGTDGTQRAHIADEVHAATIVVGDRGLNPAGHYVLDSVPAAVALHAKHHDVLIVRTATEDGDFGERRPSG
jgi:hypothetical protein